MRELHQPNGEFSNLFSPYLDPVATIQQGETVTIHTVDAFANVLTGEDTLPSKTPRKYWNPQTGPFYIEGAQPGDSIEVRFRRIRTNRDWGFSQFRLGLYSLTPDSIPMIHITRKNAIIAVTKSA